MKRNRNSIDDNSNNSLYSSSEALNNEDSSIGDSKRPSYTPNNNTSPIFTCYLPPTCSFTGTRIYTRTEFDSHYNRYHSYTCSECYKCFPSERFLELHITENHDPFFQLKLEAGNKVVCIFRIPYIVANANIDINAVRLLY